MKKAGVVARNRRAYPKPTIPLHARTLNEALTLEENLQSISIEGTLSNGEKARVDIFLPHSFTFLMMKLFALRDRITDVEKDYGRHHALDLYMIIAMMTQEDWNNCVEMHRRHKADAKVVEAGKLLKQLFGDIFSPGVLRLKENKYYRADFQLTEFLTALRELFN